MATMNYSGMLLANQALEQDEDAYVDDDEEVDEAAQRRKVSNIEFRPFNEWKNVKPWSY